MALKKTSSKKCVRIAEAFVYDSHGKVLLLKRSNKNSLYVGKWQLPGGKVKSGESPRRAVVREIFEEVGCKCVSVKPLVEYTFSQKYNGSFDCVKLFTFSCKLKGALVLSCDHSKLNFFSVRKVKKNSLTPVSRVAFSLK